MKTFFKILVASSFVIGCQPQSADKVEQTSAFPETFENGLKAHGGLEKWNSYGTLTFSEVTEIDTTKYTVDLRNRNELIEKSGHYKVGFTADDINIYPHKDSFPSENPRFVHNLRFYFFTLPLVTADEGAYQEALEPTELDGKMYNRVKVTFGDSVGVAPKDQYILWYDQTDNMLSLINYSVTYFDESRAESYNAIVYKNWTDVDGLMLPKEMIGYKWASDTLGEERYRRKLDLISVSKDRPDPGIFTNLTE